MTCDYVELALPGVRQLTPYQPGKPVETLERELGITGSIKLASNENPLGPSPRAVEAVRGCLDRLALYPDGGGYELRHAIAAKLRVAPECVTLGNGSNDILELLGRAYLGPGVSAVFSAHAFAVYPLVVQATGAEACVAAANPPDHAQPYGHDLDEMAALIDARTRIVFVANPNNPTGTWLDAERLEAFIAAIPERTLVVVDEAYFEFVRLPGYPDAVRWLDRYPNLVVTRTFSKVYGLAALRVGYGIANPQVADVLNRVRQPFNTSTPAQAAALAALADTEHLERTIEVNRQGLDQLAQGCRERGLAFIPSVGNFLCIDVARPGMPVYEGLLREGVIVRPVANYGLPTHLRVTVGLPEQNARFLSALDRVLIANEISNEPPLPRVRGRGLG